MRILGISALYHDSAAAIVVDGRIVAAAQEERFTRQKHDARFPGSAIAYCLAEAGCRLSELDSVVFYDKPFLKFERLLETYLTFAPKGYTSFRMALPLWLGEKLVQKRPPERLVQTFLGFRIIYVVAGGVGRQQLGDDHRAGGQVSESGGIEHGSPQDNGTGDFLRGRTC